MPSFKLLLRPGINTETTALLNEGGFESCNLVRFFQSLLQKLGGWARLFPQQFNGYCRGMIALQDANNFTYLAIGTNLELAVYYNSRLYDITPVLTTTNPLNAFTTTLNSSAVQITDVASNQLAGNGINLVTTISVGGLILQGYYQITSVIDADNYIITAANTAPSTVSHGGNTASYTTTNGSSTVQVTLANHGLSVGSAYSAYLSTAVGGLTISGAYIVLNIIDANNFQIDGAGLSTFNDVQSENTNHARINYLLLSGNADAAPGQGYGLGYYGLGYYGYGSQGAVQPPRRWTFAEWGTNDFLASPTNGAIYFWDSSAGVFNNPATIVSAAPQQSTAIFLAMPQQQVIALGAELSGTKDDLLIRWCDVADYNTWIATADNQAGSYRLPDGGRIIGGFQAQQQGLIWTETSLWVMQYVQPPFIYGFNKIADGCGMIGSAAMGVINSRVFWMGSNSFYMFDGSSVTSIPCTVWDKIFQNLNLAQAEKITCAVNSTFDEVSWYYPSANSNEVDSYVKLNVSENVWDYGSLARTAWLDQSIIGMPIGADTNFLIQQHEVSNDADGLPMDSWAESGWFKVSDGLVFLFIERFIPDFILSAGATVRITIYTADYPTDTPNVYGPFDVTSQTKYVMVRSRNRLASIKIESVDLGSFWRVGELLYFGSPSGRR